VEKRTLNRRIKRAFYRGALPFGKKGLKALFNRFGAESPKKALVLLLKEQEVSWSFYNLRGCWSKQIVLLYSNKSGMETARFSFFSFEKETKRGTSQPKVSLSMKN